MPTSRQLRFRRSPCVVSYWQEGNLVFENFATRRRIAAAPLTCLVLDFFSDWRREDELCPRLREYSPASIRKVVRELARQTMLERTGRRRHPAEKAMEAWKHWNPAAGFYHSATKDFDFELDPLAAERALHRYARSHPVPPLIKRYPGAKRISLAVPQVQGEFPQVLLARRTWRQFSPEPVALKALAELLWFTGCVQRWIDVPGLVRFPLRIAPSGGAMNPVEIYVLARRVAGLAPGIYHYAKDKHCLELLRRGASKRQIARYIPGQPWYEGASAVLLLTAVFARSQWKYHFARSYRAVLLDAGHISQTFCLAATWLGLAPFCTLALADSRIEEDLGIDGISESVVFALGVGTRPPGIEWAPMPAIFTHVRRRAVAPNAAGSGGKSSSD